MVGKAQDRRVGKIEARFPQPFFSYGLDRGSDVLARRPVTSTGRFEVLLESVELPDDDATVFKQPIEIDPFDRSGIEGVLDLHLQVGCHEPEFDDNRTHHRFAAIFAAAICVRKRRSRLAEPMAISRVLVEIASELIVGDEPVVKRGIGDGETEPEVRGA